MLAGLATGSAPSAARVDLELLAVAHGEARVVFRKSFSDTADQVPKAWREGFCDLTPSYRVCADPEQIQPSKYQSTFSYTFYVQPRTARGSDDVILFRFLAEPLSPFLDQEVPVDFAVKADGEEEEGSLRLPVHSTRSGHFLEYRLPEVPARLPSDGGEPISIELESRLSDLPVLVDGRLRVTSHKPHLWEVTPVAQFEPPLPAGQEELRLSRTLAPGTIRVVAKPVRSKALLASLKPYRPAVDLAGGDRSAGIHDRIVVYVPYRTRGGVPRELPVEVPIRIWPSGWSLAAAVLLGAVVGSTLPPLLGHGFGDWWWEAAASVLMAGIAWLFALVLVAFDSQVRLLGLELDPYQIIPAGLLGVLVALGGPKGAPVLKRIRLLRRFGHGGNDEGRAPEIAGGEE